MKQNTLIKQAYVRGLAARGLLRQHVMQKRAADPVNVKKINVADNITDPAIDQAGLKDSWKDYALYGGIGAGGGAAIGALIQALRNKDILSGSLVGAGVGGGLGLGTRAALNILNQTGVTSDERLQKAKDATREYVDPKEQQVVDYLNDPKNQDMIKNIAISGGVGAAGGGIIGALIQAARQKNILLGAGIGAGIGGIGGLGVGAAPYITEFSKKKYKEYKDRKAEEEHKKLLEDTAPRRLTSHEQAYLNKLQAQVNRLGYESLSPQEKLVYDSYSQMSDYADAYDAVNNLDK